MVEQEAVNFEVAGSSPASGAKVKDLVLVAGSFTLSSAKQNIEPTTLTACWQKVAVFGH